jgi:outer membrane protein OmpA-like peptidoglycan-associated protein
LPNVTVLVIGHADQRGDDESNHAISAERAEAVVDFLTYLGVSPTRLASRAVGEADLLTLADDNTALALNRRTEFVFYGVLVE